MRKNLEAIHIFFFRIFLSFIILNAVTSLFFATNSLNVLLKNIFLISTLVAVLLADNHLKHQSFKDPSLIRLASITFFIFYLFVGLFFEIFLNANRFEAQGNLWVGTATSMVLLPILITTISDYRYLRKLSLKKFTALFFLIFFIIFYYQTRAGQLFTLLAVLILFNKISKKRWLLLFTFFNLFVYLYPWTSPLKINDLKISNFCEGPAADLISVGFHNKFIDYCANNNSMTKKAIYFYCNLLPVSTCSNTTVKDTTVKDTTVKDTTVKDTTVKDIDRKTITHELILFIAQSNLRTKLLGIGVNANNDKFRKKVILTNNKKHLNLSENLLTNLPLSTFNFYLLYSGIIGILLFFSLFLLTFLRVFICAKKPEKLIALSIAFIFSLTFIGQLHNLIIFYLYLTPNGLAIKNIQSNRYN